MPTLGDMLAAARRAEIVDRWIAEADPALAEDLSRAAARDGETPGRFARIAVADFTRAAGEEAWTTLVSRLHDAPDPALACLGEMVRWRLSFEDRDGGMSAETERSADAGANDGDRREGSTPTEG